MNRRLQTACAALLLLALPGLSAREAASAAAPVDSNSPDFRSPFPWRAAGLDERAAAAHALDRLAYGARPGEVEQVVALGLDRWLERQLAGAQAPAAGSHLAQSLARLPALELDAREISMTWLPGAAILRRAERAGVITRERAGEMAANPGAGARREDRQKVEEWMEEEGIRSDREIEAQAYAQRILRAVGAESQLHERLVDFWFNHFNVSSSDNQARAHLLSYERDAIRPHVLGSFRALLGATAKHPAMLAYLDNAQSVANPGAPTLGAARRAADAARAGDRDGGFGGGGYGGGGRRGRGAGASMGGARNGGFGEPRLSQGGFAPERRPNRPQGLNENYARELLELHTLGVDGGYTQQDVVEVARAFTGWAYLPVGLMDESASRRIERAARSSRFGDAGFVAEGEFVFRADTHDAGAKTVLGVKLPAGRGIEDGERVLDLVAAHPSTARHLARKLAVRFVADEPPAALVDRLAAEFSASGGDLGRVTRALVAAPEFWAAEARGAKIKSPFEVAISALRALGATIDNPFPTAEWISRMGQPLYAYQAPSGFPDRADAWVNSGALLTRMNFGLELAAGRIGGVRFDLDRLAGGREPESPQAALARYGELLMPGRELEPTVERLAPMLARPELTSRVAERSSGGDGEEATPGRFDQLALAEPSGSTEPSMAVESSSRRGRAEGERRRDRERLGWFPMALPMRRASTPPTVVAGVVGLLLGSPEFQRR